MSSSTDHPPRQELTRDLNSPTTQQTTASEALVPDGLRAHWATWLGAARALVAHLGDPAAPGPGVLVVGSPRRTEPGWDDDVHAVVGVVDPHGRARGRRPGDLSPFGFRRRMV